MALIYQVSNNLRYPLTNMTARDAEAFCEEHGYTLTDGNGFGWGLEIDFCPTTDTVQADLLGFNADVLVHQCNCQGVMGAGIAKQFRDRLLAKGQYAEYQRLCGKWHSALLGHVQWCPLPDGRRVANLFGQDRYGRDRQYTQYDKVLAGFREIVRQCQAHSLHDVAIPYNMGCALGGGDWGVMYNEAILPAFKGSGVSLWVCSMPGTGYGK